MTCRLLFILLLCGAVTLQAQPAGEDLRAGSVFRKTPLEKVLKTLEDKYKVRIAYDHALVQNIIVDLTITATDLPAALQQILNGTPLTFQTVGNNTIIIPRPREAITPASSNITLSGTIVDADTEETLPQATLSVRGTTIAATTNNDGYFTIANIPSDTCLLTIRYLGYLTQTVRVKDIDTPTQYRVHLRSDARILNEVVVLDEYNQAVHIEETPGTIVFNPRSLSSLPALAEQDMSRTLQLMPGITATDESSSGAVIRGAHPSYNLTLLDGMTIYQQDHFFGSFSIINADIIKDIHVHKGMFDARYGGRVSGVIDITTKNGNAVKPAFNIKFNPINAKATVEIPLSRKWSFFIAGRRSFTDVAPSGLFNSLFDIARAFNDQIGLLRIIDTQGKQNRPRFYYFFDTNTKLTFRPTDRDILSLSLYLSRDKMRIDDSKLLDDPTDPITIQQEERTRWGNNGLSLRWARQWRDNYYTNVRVSASRFFRHHNLLQQAHQDIATTTFILDFQNSINDLSYAIDNEWTPKPKLSLAWGITGARQTTTKQTYDKLVTSGDSIPYEDETTSTEKESSWQHALYASITASPVNRLTVSAGARVAYYYNRQDRLMLEPRLTALYKIKEHINLKAAYGRSNQFVTQLFYPSRTGAVSGFAENYWALSQPGNVRYPVISADHLSAGTTWKHTQFVYDAEVYYKVSHGVIIDENLNSGDTHAYGLDLMAQKVTGIHRGWIAYSLSRVTQSNPYILEGRAAPSWQDQRHEIKVVDMLTLGQWTLTATLVYGSGKPYPKYDVRYLRDDNGLITGSDIQLDYRNQHRLPSYFRIDLATSYTIPLTNTSTMEISLSIYNLTNKKNIKTRQLDAQALNNAVQTNTELPATYHNIVLLGFTPTASLTISF